MRFPKLTAETMSAEQARVAAAVSGSRGGDGARGPFNLWLRAPEMCDRLQKVGDYIRYRAGLPQKLVEFAICITAREWDSAYEWHAHAALARKEGLSDAILRAVAERRRPEGMGPAESAVFEFCTELHRSRRVSDACFAQAKAALGEVGVAELTATCGYYVAVSMSLNVAEVPIPEGAVAFG